MIAPLAFLGVLASWRLATGCGEGLRPASWRLATGQGWEVRPQRPAVGDTVWLERVVAAPAGWRVRVARFDATDRVEPLADPAVERVPGGWRVRYGLVAWSPGAHAIVLPPLWLLGPDGQADSLAGGTARLELVSVLSGTTVEPKPALDPIRAGRRTAAPVGLAVAASAALLLAGVRWRRRRPRTVSPPRPDAGTAGVPDARWLDAGESRAVAARATARLRAALARAVPEAHEALSTAECLQTLARVRPDGLVRELQEILTALDEVQFAAVHGADAAALAARARALIRELP
jgi:hypothetical protein